MTSQNVPSHKVSGHNVSDFDKKKNIKSLGKHQTEWQRNIALMMIDSCRILPFLHGDL